MKAFRREFSGYEPNEEMFDMAIKALEKEPCEDATLKDIFCMGCEYKEQEPILDKIRAEIEEQEEYRCFDEDDMLVYRTGLDDALEIIDKYRQKVRIRNDIRILRVSRNRV